MLKLKFDANQAYQQEAISSIVDIFEGQRSVQSRFTALESDRGLVGKITELGYANKLDLIDEDLIKNVVKIQDRNSLKRSINLKDAEYGVPNFAIEMETGTGKTYVYSRTIMELNARYGFTKFIIVVPSVAIREGVYKSLQITEEHFGGLYTGRAFHYFIYSSSRLNEVRAFATSDAIEIMIINIDAFRKGFEEGKDNAATVIHKPSDKLEGRKPIEFIQQTSPVVIIDEPQSVDGTPKAKEAIKALNPLCILRYSATHKDTYNLMYKLGPIEAFEKSLVKKIEVLSIDNGSSNSSRIKLLSVSEKSGSYSATVMLNCIDKKGTHKFKEVSVNTNKRSSLYVVSGENDEYKDLNVSNICAQTDKEYIEINQTEIIKIGQAEDDLVSKRAQIRWTIESHLDREAILLEQGIKVLSLFFIDKVHNYREAADTKKGIYAEIFEEEYFNLIKLPKYNQLFTKEEFKSYALNPRVDEVHAGYFAQDKKGAYKDTKGDTQADESAYELIMKNKERLLSFDTSLRFIFSHSTLKEGWDNPNVFQICTLVENQDLMTKRQKIGRGLRLPVNQDGERILDDNINVLTVVANESYDSFAENLQREIEKDTNIKFGVITERLFETIRIQREGEHTELGYEASLRIYNYLKLEKLIDKNGKPSSELKEALVMESLTLPEEFLEIKKEIINTIVQTQKRLPILNRADKVKLELNKQVYLSPDFIQLWERIKYKTVYRINFNSDELIESSAKAIARMPEIKTNPVIGRWVKLQMDKKGISASDPLRIRTLIREEYEDKRLPDILKYVETYTRLKKSSIAEILIRSKTLNAFYSNPQEYMERVVEAINAEKRKIVVNGIKYEKISDHEFYKQELFDDKELIGYLKNNAIPVSKNVYSHVLYDSEVERLWAERLNNDRDIKLFTKLPRWFKIETPLGDYHPDWMILLDKNSEERLYFVIETKGSIKDEDLRYLEDKKIQCGEKHFEALGTGVSFTKADDYNTWRAGV
jgi:type III restriction enzyme